MRFVVIFRHEMLKFYGKNILHLITFFQKRTLYSKILLLGNNKSLLYPTKIQAEADY